MKFRANLREPRALLAICTTMRTFSKQALIKLHDTQIRIIALPSDAADGAQLWTSIRAASLFADLRIESKNDNAIYCEIPDIGQLVFALRACEKSSSVLMKLAKVGSRQLLSVSMSSLAVGHDTVHEIPIRVLTDTEIARIAAPPLEANVTEVHMPPLASIASFVECARAGGAGTCNIRLAPTGGGGVAAHHPDNLLVDAAGAAQATMVFSAEGPTLAFEAAFHRIGSPSGAALPATAVEVSIDIRRMARFLAVREVQPSAVTAHMAHRRALVLSAFVPGGTNLIFYLPAVVR